MSKLVRNEQRKLTATFANGVAIAAVAIGGFAQAAAMVQNGIASWASIFFGVVCFAAAFGLHLLGRRYLEALEE